MKKNNFKDWFKGKGFYISLVAGAVCVVAITAVCLDSFGINKLTSDKDKGQNLAQVEPEKEDMEQSVTPAPSPLTYVEDDGLEDADGETKEAVQETKETENQESKNKNGEKTKTENEKSKGSKSADAGSETKVKDAAGEKKVAVMEAGEKVNSLKFDQEAGISWPVTGDVIMKYSADNTVYFKTLGQYKSNPAIIISAAEGTNVSNGVEGVVTAVGQNEEIGNYVETSIGDDYKIIYGQLDNIQVEKGATIKEGELIGVIAAPTKYYSEEGSNLYFKMTCENDPVDPMIFLK